MGRMENVQLFRALACLGVFVAHLAPRMGIAGMPARAANFGAMGVYLFFLLSGFLGCRAPLGGPGGKKRGLLCYYVKRLFRLMPLYYAVILYQIVLHGLVLQDVPVDPDGLYWLRYLFLTNLFVPAPDPFWGNLGATWTVGLFAFYYITAPLWVRLAGNAKRACALYLAALLLRYAWVASGWSAYMMCFYYLHFFLLGLLVRRLWESLSVRKGALLLGAGALLLAGFLELSGLGNDYFIAWSWAFALLLLGTKNLRLPGGRLKRWVEGLDRVSYAVYLVHAVVVEGIVLVQGKIWLPAWLVFVLAAGLTGIGVFAAQRLIEEPAKKICANLVARMGM